MSDFDPLQYWSDEYARQKAERLGCTVEYADDLTLQLDLDGKEAESTFYEQYELLVDLKILPHTHTIWQRSRNGNSHVTIHLKEPLPVRTRILLQAVLGSDRKRELLSYAGVLKGQLHPVVLFRPKEGDPCVAPF